MHATFGEVDKSFVENEIEMNVISVSVIDESYIFNKRRKKEK